MSLGPSSFLLPRAFSFSPLASWSSSPDSLLIALLRSSAARLAGPGNMFSLCGAFRCDTMVCKFLLIYLLVVRYLFSLLINQTITETLSIHVFFSFTIHLILYLYLYFCILYYLLIMFPSNGLPHICTQVSCQTKFIIIQILIFNRFSLISNRSSHPLSAQIIFNVGIRESTLDTPPVQRRVYSVVNLLLL